MCDDGSVAPLGPKHAPLEQTAALVTGISAFHHIGLWHRGKRAHRTVFEHYAHPQAAAIHRAVANYAFFIHVAADAISIGASVTSSDPVALLEHGEGDILHRGAALSVVGRDKSAVRDAGAFPHAGDTAARGRRRITFTCYRNRQISAPIKVVGVSSSAPRIRASANPQGPKRQRAPSCFTAHDGHLQRSILEESRSAIRSRQARICWRAAMLA